MVKIGIICAGDREFEPFLAQITDYETSEKAMLKFYLGKIFDLEVVALYCGVCKTNAAIATQILIDNYNVDLVINAGTAGGMDRKIQIFDTVISTKVAHHDVNESILTEFHPWLPSVYFESDKILLTLSKKVVEIIKTKGKIYFGKMVTGEKFITDEGRNEINKIFEPLSVDMETASIAHTCYVNKIPFIAIRCITDTATHSGVENFDKNCLIASEISKDIVIELIKQIKNNGFATAETFTKNN